MTFRRTRRRSRKGWKRSRNSSTRVSRQRRRRWVPKLRGRYFSRFAQGLFRLGLTEGRLFASVPDSCRIFMNGIRMPRDENCGLIYSRFEAGRKSFSVAGNRNELRHSGTCVYNPAWIRGRVPSPGFICLALDVRTPELPPVIFVWR